MKDEKKLIESLRKLDKQILDGMFSGKLLRIFSKKDIKQYFKLLVNLYGQQKERYLYAHSTLQNTIGNYFGILGWDYGFEIPHGDLDSSYRFDIMAQKGAKMIIVEVKPAVTTRDLGQVLGYLYDVAKKYKKSRVFLGTDILNLPICIGEGEVADIILNNAGNGLGIIFATKEDVWIVPAEFLLV